MFRLLTRIRPGWLGACTIASAQQLTHCGGDSKHALVTSQREQQAKKEQYAAALAWCAEKEKGATAAVNAKDEDGKFFWPLISKTSLQRRLTGDTDWQDPHASSRTLTIKEEEDLVEVCKLLNRHGQGIDRAHLGRLVLDSLTLRPTLNKGRDYVPLSHNAKEMLRTGSPGHTFYQRFFAAHPDISERSPCNEEMLRVKWMTPKVSADHFTYLGMCLVSCGILVDGEIIDASRVLNSDECPNPWQGTGGRTKLIAAVGDPCKRFKRPHAIIASGLNFFAFAGRNFGSKMSLKRLFNAVKPASSSSGGQPPAPTPDEAPALCWILALVGVPNSAESSSCSPGP